MTKKETLFLVHFIWLILGFLLFGLSFLFGIFPAIMFGIAYSVIFIYLRIQYEKESW